MPWDESRWSFSHSLFTNLIFIGTVTDVHSIVASMSMTTYLKKWLQITKFANWPDKLLGIFSRGYHEKNVNEWCCGEYKSTNTPERNPEIYQRKTLVDSRPCRASIYTVASKQARRGEGALNLINVLAVITAQQLCPHWEISGGNKDNKISYLFWAIHGEVNDKKPEICWQKAMMEHIIAHFSD